MRILVRSDVCLWRTSHGRLIYLILCCNMVSLHGLRLSAKLVKRAMEVHGHRKRPRRGLPNANVRFASPPGHAEQGMITLFLFLRWSYDRLTHGHIMYPRKPLLLTPFGFSPKCCYCYRDLHWHEVHSASQPSFTPRTTSLYKRRITSLTRCDRLFKHSPF